MLVLLLLSTANSLELPGGPSARQVTGTSAAAPREKPRAQMRRARAVHSRRAKRTCCAHAERSQPQFRAQLSDLQQLGRHCVTWQGSWQTWQTWERGRGVCETRVPKTGQRSQKEPGEELHDREPLPALQAPLDAVS